ncbi:P-loop containing nucleoside triphosphate hydrolase protein, partial [Backusella circina FSU 941]
MSLSVQRIYYKRNIQLSDEYELAMKKHERRDPSVPFSDSRRVIRLLLDSSVLMLTTGTILLLAFQEFGKEENSSTRKQLAYIVIGSCATLIYSIYCLILCFTAHRFPLPDYWGWSLNIHIFVVSLVLLSTFVWNLIRSLWVQSDLLNLKLITLACSVIFSLDLVLATGTANNGAPFLDEKGKATTVLNESSIFGYFFFSWMTPIIKTVNLKQNQMTDDDLPTLAPSHLSYNIFYITERFRAQNRSILYACVFSCLPGFIGLTIMTLVTSVTRFIGPFLLSKFLDLVQDYHREERKDSDKQLLIGFGYIIAMSVTIILLNIAIAQIWFFAQASIQIRVKAMLSLEIFRKTLYHADLSMAFKKRENNDTDSTKKKEDKPKDENAASSIGMIVNLISTDVNKIASFSYYSYILLEGPLEIFVGMYLLYHLLGWSSLLGLTALVVATPINYWTTRTFINTQNKLMSIGDLRLSLMNEVLQGIRQIKFFAWEKKWAERIMKSREEELDHLKIIWIQDVVFNFLWQAVPLSMTMIAFWSYTQIEGRELTASIAFSSIIIYNELQFSLTLLPEVIIRLFETLVSLNRIQKYLDLNELENTTKINPIAPVELAFNDATLSWITPDQTETPQNGDVPSSATSTTENTDVFKLHDVNVEFPNKQLSIICGATGSGKTLLMLSLLGETELLKGSISCPRTPIVTRLDDINTPTYINLDAIPSYRNELTPKTWILPQSVAYVSQTPWLQNATIKDNILFGLPYLAKRYKETIFQCALTQDLDYLEDGDQTEIGEKGITLSGGQKARVALARAVYSRAQNVLMDNVLSAVDAHTAKHIYQRCFMGCMMKNRTQILITYHIGLCLPGCSYMVFLKDCAVELAGSPSELRRLGLLDKMVQTFDDQEKEEEEEIQATIETESDEPNADLMNSEFDRKPKVLVEDEKREKGTVQFKHYVLYFKMARGLIFAILLFLSMFATRGLEVFSSSWIARWTRSYDTSDSEANNYSLVKAQFDIHLTESVDQTRYYVNIFLLINTICIIIATTRYFILYWGTLKASMTFYEDLLYHVFRAPLRFFDKTPVGRIVNRFSKDISTIDSEIPMDVSNMIIQWMNILSIVFVSITVLPMSIVPLIFVTLVNTYLGSKFAIASRELRRMDSVSRSPMLTHFNETITGITTIRAFGLTKEFLLSMIDKIDLNSRPLFYLFMVNRWIGLRTAVSGSFVCLATGAFVLWNIDRMDSATVGFCLSYILMFSDMMFWGVRRYTSMEMSFNSVERVAEFLDMEQEAPAVTNIRPPIGWPSNGAIQVKDLEVRYAADLPTVLKGVTFSVDAKEKIGIVGRTGSGKSTLSLSFFRFIEMFKGEIIIDDINISDIGLKDLRRNLTIIPQDPVLFSGTLRSNMDPFDQFSDEDIFIALRRVHLVTQNEIDQFSRSSSPIPLTETEGTFRNPFMQLHTLVHEGGNNFSQGQRQLLCLARALLKRSKVVFMDESTSSVDHEIDRSIQKTITTEFSECTVLCISHRLLTVADYDRILVMDQGRIVENASPYELLCETTSIFYKMCRKSGEFDTILSLSKAKHELVDV